MKDSIIYNNELRNIKTIISKPIQKKGSRLEENNPLPGNPAYQLKMISTVRQVKASER
jgi:hypothetical protein